MMVSYANTRAVARMDPSGVERQGKSYILGMLGGQGKEASFKVQKNSDADRPNV